MLINFVDLEHLALMIVLICKVCGTKFLGKDELYEILEKLIAHEIFLPYTVIHYFPCSSKFMVH